MHARARQGSAGRAPKLAPATAKLAMRSAPQDQASGEGAATSKAALHKEHEYDLTTARSLRAFIVEANIRLVRAEYFWELRKKGGRFLRQQEAERKTCEDDRSAKRTR